QEPAVARLSDGPNTSSNLVGTALEAGDKLLAPVAGQEHQYQESRRQAANDSHPIPLSSCAIPGTTAHRTRRAPNCERICRTEWRDGYVRGRWVLGGRPELIVAHLRMTVNASRRPSVAERQKAGPPDEVTRSVGLSRRPRH